MDPISMAAAIGPICATAAKLLITVSEFVDAVKEAPKEVQALNSQLGALYGNLGLIREALQSRAAAQIPDGWGSGIEKLNSDCMETLMEAQVIINKARIVETEGTSSQMWKTVRFAFKSKQVAVLRNRLVMQNQILQSSLAVLSETRGQHIESQLEKIRSMVEELALTRGSVRETLVILDRDDVDSDQTVYLLQDRRAENQRQLVEPHHESGTDRTPDSSTSGTAPQNSGDDHLHHPAPETELAAPREPDHSSASLVGGTEDEAEPIDSQSQGSDLTVKPEDDRDMSASSNYPYGRTETKELPSHTNAKLAHILNLVAHLETEIIPGELIEMWKLSGKYPLNAGVLPVVNDSTIDLDVVTDIAHRLSYLQGLLGPFADPPVSIMDILALSKSLELTQRISRARRAWAGSNRVRSQFADEREVGHYLGQIYRSALM